MIISHTAAPKSLNGYVGVLGVFDGVHVGHRAVMCDALRYACLYEKSSAAITFDPHPRTITANSSPTLLTNFEHKLSILKNIGFDAVWVLPFNETLSRLDGVSFVREYLVNQLSASDMFFGEGSILGCDKSDAVTACMQCGVSAHSIKPVLINGEKVSSTRIRTLITSGNLSEASACLGRSISVIGHVIQGKQLGRTIGFPTFNLFVESGVIPPLGVYVTESKFDGKSYDSVTNIGVSPTVNNSDNVTIETFILDFDENIYGKRIELCFYEKIRDERRFCNFELLKNQIEQDVSFARAKMRLFRENDLR